MSRFLTERVRKISPGDVSPDRYKFIKLAETEPDLGTPVVNGSLFTSDTTGVRSWTTNITVDQNNGSLNVLNLAVSNTATIDNLSSSQVSTDSIFSQRSNISISSVSSIDSFSAEEYKTAKYILSGQNDTNSESLEVLLVHNSINSYITVYGVINDGANVVELSTQINNGEVELLATPLGSNTQVNLLGTYVSI